MGAKEGLVRSKEFTMRRLERACKHVSELWFPANPAIVRNIKTLIGDQSCSLELIAQEARKDFAVFLGLLRELCIFVQGKEQLKSVQYSPKELFEHAGIEGIRLVFPQLEKITSQHEIEALTDMQALSFTNTAVSATTAETIAVEQGIDRELGFSSALLRQLGFTLIAFNYAEVLEDCRRSLKPGEDLDQKITEILGFSPTMLSLSLLEEWNLSGPLAGCLDGAKVNEKSRAIGQTLQKICAVGEALARANSPETYPTASRDWEFARKEIEKNLGKKGLAQIKKGVKDALSSYTDSVPHIFKGGLVLDPEVQLARHWDHEHLQRNPFLASCHGEFRKEMYKLYDSLALGVEARHCLSTLVKDLLPHSGFAAGGIFTIDPPSKSLIPQLRVGKTTLRTLGPVRYGALTDPVVQAFEGGSPVIETKQNGEGQHTTSIAGLLGVSQRLGVLYLELPHDIFLKAEVDHLAHFKALSQAFCDCLLIG